MAVTNAQLMSFLEQIDEKITAIGQRVSEHDTTISLLSQRQSNHTQKWERLGSRLWKVVLIPIGAIILAILAWLFNLP